MKPFFIILLAASQFISSYTPQPWGYVGLRICSKPGCSDFRRINGLWVHFTGIKYYHKKKKSTVKVFCSLVNNTSDTLLLDRRLFSVSSDTSEYILQPRIVWKKGIPKEIPDPQFRIPPWPYGKDIPYSFEFSSKNKMRRNLMGSDTLRFQYSDGEQTTTIFRTIAVLDPNWTREETLAAIESEIVL